MMGLRSAPTYRRPAPARFDKAPALPLEWKLLTRAFAKPALVFEIEAGLLDAELPESAALVELAEKLGQLEDPGNVSDAMIVELLQGARHAELLARAQGTLLELGLSSEEAAAEFRAGLDALKVRVPEEERILRSKVLRGIASPDEASRFLNKVQQLPAGRPKT